MKRLHQLPRKFDAHRQGESERMHGAVGFDVCVCWYEVLQTRFCKDADIGREMVLQTEAEGGGQLARDMD